MDSRATTVEPQHSYLYQPASWNTKCSATSPALPSATTATTTAGKGALARKHSNSFSATVHTTAKGLSAQHDSHSADVHLDANATADPTAAATAGRYSSQTEFLPFLFPQQSSLYYAQLLHYNTLVSPTRGGGLQAPPLPPVVSSSNAQAGPRSRSSSKVSLKDNPTGKGSTSGGHGSRSHHNSDKNRSVITTKEAPQPKMPSKNSLTQAQAQSTEPPAKTQASRAAQSSSNSQSQPSLSSSVPSTPHQRARQFSFESRDPSPTDHANNHSPRSAYSETNSNLPSLRPLPPPRQGGCKFETSQVNSRRRIPYSNGNERLEKIPLGKIKGKLTEDEERKVATDMREVYNRLLPSERVEERRRQLVQKLEKIFNDEWPGHDIKAHLFGSSGNLLCSDDSDVDICITTSWHEMEAVCMVADLLARRGMEKIICISAAKVPIVKMWDPELKLSCDMNVNNTLALENTRMIRIYIEIDPRVRQLAMIIKYWTKRRIVNDAAFGGTLSSYTWICLIIAFLQLRTPSVLPTLHSLPYKTQKPNGVQSEFADNLKKLKGFGKNNKSSEADLLFQFFRFYAHEFDYDKYVLSIRLGRLISKNDKNWHYALNNQLCVEEPFNTSRNLGNTVDEYSFKGLHQELRRAFDLISAAKLEEACEEYVFPKEEERVWSRPPPQPRPVLLRSASQTHTGSGRGGRGGHRGGRHGNYHRGGGTGGAGGNGNANGNGNGHGSNRRSSSSVPAYDPNLFAPAVNIQQDLTSWFQSAQFPIAYTPEMLYAYQQENLRQIQQLYAQNPAYNQHQNMGQPVMGGNSVSNQAQSSDRSRTNSFDNAPLSAPMRPELYAMYGMTLGQPTFFAQPAKGYGTYPSSPATPIGNGHDYRRPLQRSTATTDKGAPTSSSSLRSQSQPAARSQPPGVGGVNGQHSIPMSQSASNVPAYGHRNNANGVAMPNFISTAEDDFDETPKANSISPQSEEDGKYVTYFPENTNLSNQILLQQQQQAQLLTNGIAFGEMANQGHSTLSSSPSSGRLSSEQLPQTLLERRMKRSSRSPSPLGHARAQSGGVNPASATSPSQSKPAASTRPLVVNGSSVKAGPTGTQRPYPATETPTSDVSSTPSVFDNSSQNHQTAQYNQYNSSPSTAPSSSSEQPTAPKDRPPVIVNGSNAYPGRYLQSDDTSFRERIAMMSSQYMNPQPTPQDVTMFRNGYLTPMATRQMMMSYQPAIAPLDLAISDDRVRKPMGSDVSLLSPVYETRTPSPTVVRKVDQSGKAERFNNPAHAEAKKTPWTNTPKPSSKDTEHGLESSPETLKQGKSSKSTAPAAKTNGSRENGHARGSSDSGWQKAGKNKKKGASHAPSQQGHAEPPPKRESERKGG